MCLFGPDAAIPPGYSIVQRISCSALPVRMGILAADEGGRFLDDSETPLCFSYTIGENDPSNPFYHPLHPQFDGLQGDFKTPSPSGANITNYIHAVKPERFPIHGKISLSFDPAAHPVQDSQTPVTGKILWGYSGLRRNDTIYAGGTFSLVRISPLGSITRE